MRGKVGHAVESFLDFLLNLEVKPKAKGQCAYGKAN
jgi:hypothetical protein